MNRRGTAARLLLVLMLASILLVAGCAAAETKTGTVQSVGMSIPLSEVMAGKVTHPTYTGAVTVKLDGGTSVEASVPVSVAKNLKGGEKATVRKNSSGGWDVVGTPAK